MPKQQHYKIVKAAFAVLLFFVFSAVALPSFSASFGRLAVLSSLGQPLRAEVELLDVLPEESASLNAGLAPVGAYRLSGIDYAPLLQSLKISVEKDGERHFISIRSLQPINEPYIGILLELVSGTDRKGNEYAIMLDPEEWTNLRSAPLSSAASMENLTRQQRIGRQFSQISSFAAASPSTVLRQTEDKKTKEAQSVTSDQKESEYKVLRGDSLSKIANRLGYRDISLEQMLVVLYRNNPDAFLNDNMNLLKEGAVLSIPNLSKNADVSRQEAQTIVKLHAANFQEYSLKLAEIAQRSAPRASPKTGSVSEGKITTKVKEQPTPVNQSPDRLELSKAQSDLGSKEVTTEEKIAINKAIEDTNQRITELEKNVNELRNLLDVVSNKGKALVDPAETIVSRKKLAAQKQAEADKKEIDKKIKVDDKEGSSPVSAQDEKNIPSSGEKTSSEKVGLSPDQTLAKAKSKIEESKKGVHKDTKAKEIDEEKDADEEETDVDEDEEEEEDTEIEKEIEEKKKVGFLQNLQSNRTWHIAIGGIVALLVLIVLVMKMMGRKKPQPRVVKTSSVPKEKPVEEVNPNIISGRDYLENLTGKELLENEDGDGTYREMVDDEEEISEQESIVDDSSKNEVLLEEELKNTNEIQELSFATLESPVLDEPSQLDNKNENGLLEVEKSIQLEVVDDDAISLQSETDERKEQLLEETNSEETSLELNLSDINLELEQGETISEEMTSSEKEKDEDYNAEMAAKLELALAYIDMKDNDGARELLEEVIARGTPQQVLDAEKALQSL